MDVIKPPAVRDFCENDAQQLLKLMKGLAVFEGYADRFAITEEDLIKNGLGEHAKFRAFVAQDRNKSGLCGMAVTYVIPWTYDKRPVLVLKELFVSEEARGSGIGRLLMDQVVAQAREIRASSIQWTVLRDNDHAKQFYMAFGANEDPDWERWILLVR